MNAPFMLAAPPIARHAAPGSAGVRTYTPPVEILSSRVLLRPVDPERSRAFYRDQLGLAIFREFGTGPERGTVFFLGNGLLEVSGRAAGPAGETVELWMQVRDLAKTHRTLRERDVKILREPKREPWGLDEMWIADPDGVRIAVVEVPPDHPIRRRTGTD